MLDGLNRFTHNPTGVSITRSKMDRSFDHKTTFDSGRLIPIYVDEVLPGDTVSLGTAAVCRMTTPIHPVMDNAFLDIYYFFVPMRLVWEHSKEFFGENTEGPWYSETEYTIPQVRLTNISDGALADYFGLPYTDGDDTNYYANALPFRSYALIWNEYFRDQNTMTPIPINKGDSLEYLSMYSSDIQWYEDLNGIMFRPETKFFGSGNVPLPVCKFHDQFTSALPSPQKGPAVTLPIVANDVGLIPVGTYSAMELPESSVINNTSLSWTTVNGNTANYGNIQNSGGGTIISQTTPASGQVGVYPANLFADTNGLDQVTINAFRQALALQGLYELDARGGTRYREIIKSHFGVTSPDARMQVPEFLHGKRIPVSMSQVLQTSSSDDTSPQGNTAAYSLTQDVGNSFTYSATEHGYILGLCCVRTSTSYQERIERMWSRRRRFDFYWPVFANLGEQPVYEKELYWDEFSGDNNGGDPLPDSNINLGERVFGFQEAWYEYRYKPSMITGKFRSRAFGTLDDWHYSQELDERPTLSPNFMIQPQEVVDRTLAVQDEPQFIADFYFQQTWVRPMPMYSIPALLGKL